MDAWVQAVIVAVTSVAASSGLWSFLQSRGKTQSATTRLLMGLAYDKISQLGMRYIERGWISKDEYEDLRKYLYEPYRDLGGNGSGDRIMEEVKQLPLRSYNKYSEIIPPQRKGENDSEQSRA